MLLFFVPWWLAVAADGAASGGSAGVPRQLSDQEQQVFDLINSDPLDLKNTLPGDYTNWASLLSHVKPTFLRLEVNGNQKRHVDTASTLVLELNINFHV
jgi:hypothetical protein